MAIVEAASSLYHILKDLELEERRETQQRVYAVPAFLWAPIIEQAKNLRVLLEQQPLASQQIILWYDVLKNSISSHCTNNHTPCPRYELLAYLQTKPKQIKAIV